LKGASVEAPFFYVPKGFMSALGNELENLTENRIKPAAWLDRALDGLV
jgi:hypothetical protein